MIEVKNVTKDYGGVIAVKGVSLVVEKGEWITIMGPSGSGKTTLLNIIGGLDRPTSGNVIVDGIDITSLTEDELSEWRCDYVGFVFQHYHLIPYLTALENVMLAQYLHSSVDESEAEDVLIRMGLKERLHHYPSQLSGGEQQRIAIARALINNPSILIADEPTGNLDRETGRKIMELISNLRKQRGLTVVMATHNASLTKWSDRVYIMEDGRLVREA